MDILSDIYSKSVLENERNLRFWDDYCNSLKNLDLKVFSDKLTVPVLVPVGSRFLFRGELKHTNEVTVAIGADYFAKCSIAQAEVLRQHRIKDAQSKVDMFVKGKEYLENQLSFRKDNLYHDVGQEIVETYSDNEDKAWRVKHRENVRQHKIRTKTEGENKEGITDEELWDRLEELELQEEMENELVHNTQNPLQKYKPTDTIGVKGKDMIYSNTDYVSDNISTEIKEKENLKKEKTSSLDETSTSAEVSKLELLQKVINRQNELDERLQELKQKERSRSKTERDLLERLDELEQLDELEDEMDRLDDIIVGEGEGSDEEESLDSQLASSSKRSVSFADEDDSKTVEITFKHTEIPSSPDAYDPSKGIQKPSDIYSAYPSNFSKTTSILKKKKYSDNPLIPFQTDSIKQVPKVTFMQTDEDEETENQTIVVGDVIERVDQNGNMVENTESRPISLFKKKRMQKKT